MNYEEIILKVSRDLDLPKDFVDKVYKGYWKAINEIITALLRQNYKLIKEYLNNAKS